MRLERFSIAILISCASLSGCTGQLPGTFRLAQQEEVFNTQLEINTKIDMLWVVDNSSSMDVSQEKLRKGFDSFARRYMQPTWDIRAAVITTDAYLAHPAFAQFLEKVVPYTGQPWKSPYMNSKVRPVTNPIFNPISGMFDDGVRYRDLVPIWGSDYARLLPGVHDGPIPGLCFEGLPYFLRGVSECAIRDDISPNRGPANCLNPAAGESSLTQCVNTVENNTIHTGRPIVSTVPPVGIPADAAWTQSLVDDFRINVTTGSVGFGSERGLGSVLQLLTDNEGSETAFFRPGSLRAIVFVSDEDDQTLDVPLIPSSTFNPWTAYRCDQASLEALNPSKLALVSGMNGFCCSDPAKNCRYGSEGTSCPLKNIDGRSFPVSVCPREDKLIPVSEVKDKIDLFFKGLDEGKGISGPANYFVASIVPLTGEAITALQIGRDADDVKVGGTLKTIAVDRGDRYLQLGEAVGNGAIALDISASDYSPILDAIGKSILDLKSTFTLVRAPTGTEEMSVTIVHADGSREIVPSSKFVVNGKSLKIIDEALLLSFASTDRIAINYQPKTLY